MEADAVGMEAEALGELHRPGRPFELREHREDVGAGGLCQDVVRADWDRT
jgi:hypothetical protein